MDPVQQFLEEGIAFPDDVDPNTEIEKDQQGYIKFFADGGEQGMLKKNHKKGGFPVRKMRLKDAADDGDGAAPRRVSKFARLFGKAPRRSMEW